MIIVKCPQCKDAVNIKLNFITGDIYCKMCDKCMEIDEVILEEVEVND